MYIFFDDNSQLCLYIFPPNWSKLPIRLSLPALALSQILSAAISFAGVLVCVWYFSTSAFFFRCLDLAANQAFLGVVGSRLIAKLAANISTSHTLSSSNTYLLLVPTVAPSNLEQSKRQVVGNLVSSNDKTSQHRIVGVLDEEEEKQNILRRKVPSTVEGTRPSNSRIGSNLSLQRQKQISGHCSVHSGKTISSAGKDHSAIHKQPRQHCSSPTDISILTDNLQQLVSASERGYAIGNKQHQTVS